MVVLLPSTESEVWCGTPSKERGASTSCFNLSSHWQTCSLAIIYSHKEDTRHMLVQSCIDCEPCSEMKAFSDTKDFVKICFFIPCRLIHTLIHIIRHSDIHRLTYFQCDLLWNQGGSRLISSRPALKTSLMPDLHVSLYNIWQRASGAIHQTSSSTFHAPHTEWPDQTNF